MDWLAFISETEDRIARLGRRAPELSKGFSTMSRAAKREDALSEKTKEFIALGIGISTRCDSCIGFHARSLARLRATEEEVTEVVEMAAYMGGGPSIAYGAKALEAFAQFKAQQDCDSVS
ncbi:carboxymuconolactone decarboxylase family protein [Pseudooceanicola sp.]|uniref:carboxymuconolactone decarboxylase family protein n=1 Tax=Pseudooceanicola sp. TaxID=1914328 RepID=UPI003515FDBF